MSRVDPPICCSCCKPFPQPHDAEDVHLKYTTAQLRPLYIRIYCWVCCLSQLDADLFHVFFCGRVMKKRWLLLHTQRQCYGTLLFPNEILGRDRLTKPMTPTRAAHISLVVSLLISTGRWNVHDQSEPPAMNLSCARRLLTFIDGARPKRQVFFCAANAAQGPSP